MIPSSVMPKKIHLKFGTSYQGITNKPMYLFKELKHFNCFIFIENFNLCFKVIWVSFSLFLLQILKNLHLKTPLPKELILVKFSLSNAKYAIKSKLMKQHSYFLCKFFETHFLVLQAKLIILFLVKNVLTACLMTTPITGIQGNWVIEHTICFLQNLFK